MRISRFAHHKPAMVCIVLSFSLLTGKGQKQKDYPIQPVNFTQVSVDDQFWKPRLEANTQVTIPANFKKCAETGRIDNFMIAGKLKKGKFRTTFPFDDSDVYKVIEGASYTLAIKPDPALSRYLDTLISYIGAAQQPDGYLQTWRIIDPKAPPTDWSGDENRWSNIQSGHELYNMGHFYEAAVAYYTATGKRSLLDMAIRNANLIVNTFGPGKIITVPGHPEIEIGLIKLYRATGNTDYLNEAKFFIDHRGKIEGREKLYGEYAQDKTPVLEADEAVGHAVRAAYLYSGMTDISAITGDTAYLHALEKIWNNVVNKKIYLTGGIGAKHEGEAFGANYELPNQTAYNETCAAIANILWNQRMFLMTGNGKYVDVLERTLYNGMLAGVSLEGDHFFYTNPLTADGKMTFNIGACTRSPWFDCSCCPSNVSRFIPSLPGYIYATVNDKLFVNLFIQSNGHIALSNQKIDITQTTSYPWNNQIKIILNPETTGKFDLNLRLPGWAREEVMPGDLYHYADQKKGKIIVQINGKETKYNLINGYAVLNRIWKKGDVVELILPMDIRAVQANVKDTADNGKLAVVCGPIVYCAESMDNSMDVLNARLHVSTTFTKTFDRSLLGGIMVITTIPQPHQDKITLIPYYAWSNRGIGKMAVWVTADLNQNRPGK